MALRAAHPAARGPVQLQPQRRRRPRVVGARDISRRDARVGDQRPGAAARPGPRAWTRTAGTPRPPWRRRSRSRRPAGGRGSRARRRAVEEELSFASEEPETPRRGRRRSPPPRRSGPPRRSSAVPILPRRRRSRRSCSWTTRRTCAGSWPSTSREAGYQVVEAEDPDAAVKKARRLGKAGIAVPAGDRPRHAHLGRLLLPGRLRGGEAPVEDEPAAARPAHDGER